MSKQNFKRGDTRPKIEYEPVEDNRRVSLPNGVTATFSLIDPDDNVAVVADADASVESTDPATLSYTFAEGETDVAGDYEAEFEITYSDGGTRTFPDVGTIPVSIHRGLDAEGTVSADDTRHDVTVGTVDAEVVTAEELSVSETYLGRLAETPTDSEIGTSNVALYFKENDDTLYKRPRGGTETSIEGSGSFDEITDVQTGTLSNRPAADGSQGWYFTTDGEGVYLDNGSWNLIAEHPANIAAGDLGFDPATQGELDTHAGAAGAHHAKTTSSDIDHANVSNVLSDQHHTKTVSTDLESGGSDEMDVSGLPGDLADPQDPKSHDNTDHSTNYSPQTHDHSGEAISPQTTDTGELLLDEYPTADDAPAGSGVGVVGVTSDGHLLLEDGN